jgi:predicted ribosome quality control (RQC) complex YloA/Tae2 family protein
MKYNELKEVTKYLQNFNSISSIKRVSDTVIKIVFNKDETIFFDMKKGDSHIFKKDSFKRLKIYNAPFDVVLYKRFARSKIEKIELLEANRVLRISVNSSSSYKSLKTTLQLEFTGRNTNAIILDEKEIVLEALRHIDLSVSYRSIKVGEALEALPKYEVKEKDITIKNIEKFLKNEYEKRAELRLNQIKNQKLISLQKKIDKFQKILNSIESEENLLKKSEKYEFWGTLILSNLHLVKGYEKEIVLKDWEDNEVKIKLPKEARSASEAGNILFESSKKLKRKAKSLYKERENLQSKIEFLKSMQRVVKKSKDENEINILLPKQKRSKKQKSEQKHYETFFLEGHKIMLGKNEKGNIELLKEAKKRDIWMHIKDIPSCHVIIRTDKKSVPQSVLDFAGKICVEFSVTKKGTYLVDYTQRHNVSIKDGANVTYVDYKTMYFEE